MMHFEISPEITSYRKELEVALNSSFQAGDIISNNFGKVQHVEVKYRADLVTSTDEAANDVLLEQLRTHFPQDEIISEEGEAVELSDDHRQWLVDPLDGTISYVYEVRKDAPSVMLALREQGETVLSTVYFPLTQECYYAVKDQGAYYQEKSFLSNLAVVH